MMTQRTPTSDYFGALMRSSGMAIAGRAVPMAVPRADPSTPAEADVIHCAASTVATTPPAPTAQHPTEPTLEAFETMPLDQFVERSPMPTEAASRDTPPIAPESQVAIQSRPPRASVPISAEAPTQAANVTSARRPPILGHTVVRAAMEWVAAGPQQVNTKPPVESTIAPPSGQAPATAGEPGHFNSLPPFHGEPRPDTPPGFAQPMLTTIPKSADTHEPAVRLAYPAAVRTEPIAASPHRDETVEVSIGAIHVRVDAPAAQTVARPPAPLAAVISHPNGPLRERSVLGRRALRRI
jgi:hypothetical protein